MKPLLLIALLFTGCTTYHSKNRNGDTVDYTTGARNNDVTFYDSNGHIRAHWGSNDNVAVWDAAGRFVGSVGAGIAEGMLAHGVAKAVESGATNGVQLVAAVIPPTTQHFVSRNTNRATPVPVIVTH